MVYKIWAVLLLPKNRILSRVTLKSFSFSFLWHQTRNFKTSKHIAVLQQFLYKYVFFSFTQRDVKEGGGDLVGASLLSIMLVAVTVQEKFLSFPDKDVFSHGDSHVYQTGKRLTQVFQCHFTKPPRTTQIRGFIGQAFSHSCVLRCILPFYVLYRLHICFCVSTHLNILFMRTGFFFFFWPFQSLVYPKCQE